MSEQVVIQTPATRPSLAWALVGVLAVVFVPTALVFLMSLLAH